MNLRVDVPRPAIMPAIYTPLDDALIGKSIENPDGDTAVSAHARRQFLQDNPQAIGAEAKVGAKRKEIEGDTRQRDRLLKARDRTPLFKHPDARDRERPPTFHERLKYLLFQSTSLGGMALATHVLATYMANSNVIPDLSGNYPKALLFAVTPFVFALGIKALAILPDLEEDRQRYLRWLCGTALVSGVGFIVSAAFAFAPHTIDVGALSESLVSGSDPDGMITKSIKTVAPYALTLTHLFTEVALAPLLAMGADALHASGRKMAEQFSERGKLLQKEITRLNKRIARLSDEVAIAAAEFEMLAAAERDAVRAAVNRRAELKADLDHHLVKARKAFRSSLEKSP